MMMTLDVTTLLLAAWILAQVALFLFNGLESALVSLDKEQPEGCRELAEGGSAFDRDLFQRPMSFVGLALLGSSFSLALVVVTTVGLIQITFSSIQGTTMLLAVLLMVPYLFVMVELVPRNLFRRRPLQLVRLLRLPLRLAIAPFRWMARILAFTHSTRIDWLARAPGSLLDMRATREELRHLLQATTESERVADTSRFMIRRLLEAQDQAVEQIMHPLDQIVSRPEETPVEELVSTIVQNGFSRIPIWRGDPKQIIGFVHATDLLDHEVEVLASSPQILVEPTRVAPETTLFDLLRQFKLARGHMAIVESPPGEAVGLLTIEDVLERVIGEIRDEHDPKQAGIRQLFRDTFLVEARLDIETVNQALELQIPQGEYDTLSGFLLSLFRKIPSTGDERIHGNALYVITKSDGKRVEQAIVKKLTDG